MSSEEEIQSPDTDNVGNSAKGTTSSLELLPKDDISPQNITDDGFGDFDDDKIVAQETKKEVDDFGDFDAEDGIKRSAPASADPYVTKVSSVFARVFGRFSVKVANPSSQQGDDTVKVSDVLSELSQNKYDISKSRNVSQTMESLLSDVSKTMVKKCETEVISEYGFLAPFSSFSSPFNEAKAIDTTAEISIPQQAPTKVVHGSSRSNDHKGLWDEPPSHTAGSRGEVIASEESLKEPSNVFGASSQNGGSKTDDKRQAKQPASKASKLFLEKIPDLSFMLSSDLVLPR